MGPAPGSTHYQEGRRVQPGPGAASGTPQTGEVPKCRTWVGMVNMNYTYNLLFLDEFRARLVLWDKPKIAQGSFVFQSEVVCLFTDIP